MNTVLFTLLSSSSPWIYGVFSAVRKAAVSGAGKVTGIALIFASLVVVFKLIRFSYALMSDEQSSGFGQIDVKVVLRPFLILMLIEAFPAVIGAFDGMVNGASMSIMGSINFKESNEALRNACDALNMQEEIDENPDNVLENALSNVGTGKIITNWKATNAVYNELKMNGYKLAHPDMEGDPTKKELRKWERKLTDAEKSRWIETANDLVTTTIQAKRPLRHPISWVATAVAFIFEQFYYVIESFAEVFLCILALLGPIACAMALFDATRGAIGTYFMKYAQVSFWKVIAAAVLWVVQTVRTSTGAFAGNLATDAIRAIQDGATTYDLGGCTAIAMTNVLICLAGFICLLNVPSMASAIIPAAGGEGAAIGGVAIGTLRTMGRTAGKAGSAAAGTVSRGATASSGGATSSGSASA